MRFVDVAASAMLANIGLKRDNYRAKFVAYPEAVQAHLDAMFKHLVDAMNAQTYVDLLGELYAKRAASTRKALGAFYTPQPVGKFITCGRSRVLSRASLHLLEPSAGLGGLILAAAEMFVGQGHDLKYLRVTAYDADLTACHCAFVNTTLWETPCLVRHGLD